MKIKHALLTGLAMIAVFIVFTNDARACITGPWRSEHKTMHFVGTAAAASVVTAVTDNANYGFAAGVIAGAAREIQKEHMGAHCEWASITYDLAGSLTGSYALKHWIIEPQRKGLTVAYSREF